MKEASAGRIVERLVFPVSQFRTCEADNVLRWDGRPQQVDFDLRAGCGRKGARATMRAAGRSDDRAIDLCRLGGRKVRLRGDTDFSQTTHPWHGKYTDGRLTSRSRYCEK